MVLTIRAAASYAVWNLIMFDVSSSMLTPDSEPCWLVSACKVSPIAEDSVLAFEAALPT